MRKMRDKGMLEQVGRLASGLREARNQVSQMSQAGQVARANLGSVDYGALASQVEQVGRDLGRHTAEIGRDLRDDMGRHFGSLAQDLSGDLGQLRSSLVGELRRVSSGPQAKSSRSGGYRMMALMVGMGTLVGGAAAAYLVYSEQGRAQRQKLANGLGRAGSKMGIPLGGLQMDRTASLDSALKVRIEQVLYGEHAVDRDAVSVDTRGHTVYLRGQVTSRASMDEILAQTRSIEGVGQVVNLLTFSRSATDPAPRKHKI